MLKREMKNKKKKKILLMKKIISLEKMRLVDLVIIIVITIKGKNLKHLLQIIKNIKRKITLNFIKKEWTKKVYFLFSI